MTTAEDVKREIEENLDVEEMRRQNDEYNRKEGDPPEFIKEITWKLYQVGEWIHWRMEQDGATEQESKDQSFVIGQCSFPNRDPFNIAAQVYDRWRTGRELKPGRELGDTLIDGMIYQGIKRNG